MTILQLSFSKDYQLKSFQNLVLLQNLYRLKALGFEYTDPFSANRSSDFDEPTTLDQLIHTIHSCHLCDLNKSRKQSMYGFGDSSADLMLLDFRVSSHEDETNSYYGGKSGDLLNKMIQNVLHLSKEEVYFTHLVKCKPLNANTPSNSEIESCRPYLKAQIEFVKPKVIVTLGEDAYYHFTGEVDNFQTVRGHVIALKSYKLIPIFHPQYLLRNPESKKLAMRDLQTIKSCL